MKLEETENLKLQYVKNIQNTTSNINIIHDNDTELSEKITEILNTSNGAIIAKDTDTALPNAVKNNKIVKMNHRNIENQLNH